MLAESGHMESNGAPSSHFLPFCVISSSQIRLKRDVIDVVHFFFLFSTAL